MMFMGLQGDSSNGPAGITCSGQVWSDFYSSCVDPCPDGQSYNSQGICSGGGATSAGGTSQSDPWWGTLTRALATGVTVGAGQLIVGQTPHPVAPPPTPWYMTPLGILGIVIVIGGGAYFIAKK